MADRKPKLLLVAALAALTLPFAGLWLTRQACGRELAYPGAAWQERTAEEAGFDPAALTALERAVGGAGCLVAEGYLVHAWGPYDQDADIASAVKPLIVHFTLLAHQDRLIPDLDGPLAEVRPELSDLNPDLGYKDRAITWRQMMRQVSGYGVREGPGEAFNYSDPQMALLWDTLVHHVYKTRFVATDGKDLLGTRLTGPLQCEDEPRLTREGRLRISARDLARIGLLYLGEGCWRGKRLIHPGLVRMAVASPLPPGFPRTTQEEAGLIEGQRTLGKGINMEAHQNSYSYCWWMNGVRDDGERVLPDAPADAYGAFGHGGRHALIIIPSRRLVLSWVIGLGEPYPWRFSLDGRKRVNKALRPLFQGPPG